MVPPEKNILVQHLQAITDRTLQRHSTHGTILSILYEQKEKFSWTGASGDLLPDHPYFLSSVAKLHITALIMKLRVMGKLKLSEPLNWYIPQREIEGLHHFRKEDFTSKITLLHLLTHRSGLPDYFDNTINGERTFREKLVAGIDNSWTYRQSVDAVKKMESLFAPGHNEKIHYSDTNFQLLVKVIENICGDPIFKVLEKFHLRPLGLTETYIYKDTKDRTPAAFYYQDKKLFIPNAMASFGMDGGMVSTAAENMTFLKAFFHGHLFPQEYLKEMQNWLPMGKGSYYGWGISLYRKPWYTPPFGQAPDIIGHTGMTGSFAFYIPEKKLFLTGTVNQLAEKSLPYKLAMEVAGIFKSKK